MSWLDTTRVILALVFTTLSLVGCSPSEEARSVVAISTDPVLHDDCPVPVRTSAAGDIVCVAVQYMSEVNEAGLDEQQITAVVEYLRTS